MVKVYNVNLNHKKHTDNTDLTVSFDILFSKYDVKYKFDYNVKVEIKGRDFESITDDELLHTHDDILELNDSFLANLKNGVMSKQYSYNLPNKKLDEDKGSEEDEIYAKVTVTPLIPCADSAISNIIREHFE